MTMGTKHRTAVKDHLSKLRKSGSGDLAFYYIVEKGAKDPRRTLHVSRKSGAASRFGDVTKINKHLKAKKFGDQYPTDAKACAGKVSLHNGKLFFEIKLKKNGAGPTDLKNGLKSLKSRLSLGKYAIAEAPEEGEKRSRLGRRLKTSRENLEASASRIEHDARQEKREVLLRTFAGQLDIAPDRIDDAKLARYLSRIETYTSEGGTEDFSALSTAIEQEQKHRVRQQKRLDSIQRGQRRFTPDPRAFSDGNLEKLQRLITSYTDSSGTEDFSDLLSAVTSEQRRRADFARDYTPIQDASSALLESSSTLMGTGQDSLEQTLDDVDLADLDRLLGDLQAQRARLGEQKASLEALLSA